MDLDCNVLNGLPERFASFVDGVWTASENPSIEDVRVAVLTINAGQMNRTNDKALAARMTGIEIGGSEGDLKAFYAGLKRSGKGPSREHPCARCQSHDHWVIDCHNPPSTNEASGFKGRRGKKREEEGRFQGERTGGTLLITFPNFLNDRAALIAHTNLTSFNDKSEISHLLLTIDEATSFAAHSSQWILDSGASENMTGDRAWFESLHPMGSTVRIATAGGASLASHSLGSVHPANHKGERVVLGRVLFVPGLAFNLLSVSRLANIGAHIEFKDSLCKVTKENVEVLRADLEQKVWVVKGDQWEPGLRALEDGKLAPRARLCCFLGYSNTQKDYKLWDPIERTVVISRDVTFDETISPSRLERPATPLSDLKSKLPSIERINCLYR